MFMPAGISKKRFSGIALFKWTLLTPFFGVLLLLVPVFLLQLYFGLAFPFYEFGLCSCGFSVNPI